MSIFTKKSLARAPIYYWRDIAIGERLMVGDRFLLDDNKTFSYINHKNLRFESMSTLSGYHKPHQRKVLL